MKIVPYTRVVLFKEHGSRTGCGDYSSDKLDHVDQAELTRSVYLAEILYRVVLLASEILFHIDLRTSASGKTKLDF